MKDKSLRVPERKQKEVMESKQKGSKEEVVSSARSGKEEKIKTEESWSDLSPRKALVFSVRRARGVTRGSLCLVFL